MEDAGVWEVDHIAAAALLDSLKQAPQADWGSMIESAFAQARLQNCQWAARRVHQGLIRMLEVESVEALQRREAAWADGFRHAEQCLMAQTPATLLEMQTRPARSRGQILRTLLRSARRQVMASPDTD